MCIYLYNRDNENAITRLDLIILRDKRAKSAKAIRRVMMLISVYYGDRVLRRAYSGEIQLLSIVTNY